MDAIERAEALLAACTEGRIPTGWRHGAVPILVAVVEQAKGLQRDIQSMQASGEFQSGFIECKIEAVAQLEAMADRMESMRHRDRAWDAVRTAAAHVDAMESPKAK